MTRAKSPAPAAEQVADMSPGLAASEAGADLDAAISRLLPPAASRPSSVDAIAQRDSLMARLRPGPGAVEQVASWHRDSIDGNPDLAAELRTSEVAEDLGMFAVAGTAPPAHDLETIAQRDVRVRVETRRRFARLIAEQIVERDPEHAAARAVLAALDAEQARLDEAARLEAERAVAVAVAEQERRAAAAAERAARTEAVRAAAARAEEAREQAVRADREHRRLRGDLVAERIRVAGCETIRDHFGRAFDAAEMVRVAHDLPPHELAVIERALDRLETEGAS